mgnify:CR=1 FL=1|jgi:hypothetical protein
MSRAIHCRIDSPLAQAVMQTLHAPFRPAPTGMHA